MRTELDHHLPILHADDGPFAGCVDGEHRLPSPATYPVADVAEPAPAGVWVARGTGLVGSRS